MHNSMNFLKNNLFIYFLITLFLQFVFINLVLAEEPTKLKVAMILPLSGDGASFGQAIKNGFELGLQKISPEAKSKMDITYEDDSLNAKNAIAAYNKLNSTKGVDVVFLFSSGVGNAIAPILENKKVTTIAIASDANVVKGRDYIFNFWMTPDVAVAELIKEYDKRGYKSIARIGAQQEGIYAYKNSFDKQNNAKFEMVFDEEVSPSTKDFRAFFTKLKSKKKFDAFLIMLMPGQIGAFAKQARQLGFNQDLTGAELFEDPNEVQISGGALLNQWYVNYDEPDAAFSKEYASKFPKASSYASANGHDFALLLADALSKGYDAKNLNEYFKKLKDFKGALGTYSSSGDQRFTLPATIKVVKENGFEKLYPTK